MHRVRGRLSTGSAKTRTMGRHQRQLVTGLVVNDRARLPRPMRRRLRAVIHDIECRGLAAAVSRSPWVTENQLWGYFSFSGMLDDVANEFPMSLSKNRCNQRGPGQFELCFRKAAGPALPSACMRGTAVGAVCKDNFLLPRRSTAVCHLLSTQKVLADDI